MVGDIPKYYVNMETLESMKYCGVQNEWNLDELWNTEILKGHPEGSLRIFYAKNIFIHPK